MRNLILEPGTYTGQERLSEEEKKDVLEITHKLKADEKLRLEVGENLQTPLQPSHFGLCFDLPPTLHLVIGRDNSGLKVFSGSWASRPKLGHQIYLKELVKLIASDIREIIAWNMRTGEQHCLYLADGEHTCIPDKTKDIPWNQKKYKTCKACTEQIAEDDWMQDGIQCPACGMVEKSEG